MSTRIRSPRLRVVLLATAASAVAATGAIAGTASAADDDLSNLRSSRAVVALSDTGVGAPVREGPIASWLREGDASAPVLSDTGILLPVWEITLDCPSIDFPPGGGVGAVARATVPVRSGDTCSWAATATSAYDVNLYRYHLDFTIPISCLHAQPPLEYCGTRAGREDQARHMLEENAAGYTRAGDRVGVWVWHDGDPIGVRGSYTFVPDPTVSTPARYGYPIGPEDGIASLA